MRPTLAIAATVLFALIVLGGLWQPHDPDAVNVLTRHAAPSLMHPLGTDHIGRDLASRMLVAGWRTATVVLAVALIGFLGGSLIGTAAVILGGWREQAMLRAVELFIVVPTLVWAPYSACPR